jgi:hypothetical protein
MNERIGALLHAFQPVFFGSVTGYNDDRYLRADLPDASQNFGPVQVGQLEVQQDQEKLIAPYKSDRFPAGVTGSADTSSKCQSSGQHIGIPLFVIDNQDIILFHN